MSTAISAKGVTESQSDLISLLRVLSVFLIVSCHVMQGLSNQWAWVLNTGVQFFFCISAFLFGKKNVDSAIPWLKRRIGRIIVPYYVYLLIVSLFILIFSKEMFSWTTEISYALVLQGIWRGYDCLNHLWFLTWILFCYFITPLLQKISDRSPILTCVFSFSLLALSVISVRSTYLFLYCIMYLISRNGLEKKLWLLIICVIASVVTIIFFSWNQIKDMGSLYSIVFHLVIGITLFLLILNIRARVIVEKIRNSKVIEAVDKYSYEIYLTHHIVIVGPFSLLYSNNNLMISLLIIIVFILIQSVLIKKLSAPIQKII